MMSGVSAAASKQAWNGITVRHHNPLSCSFRNDKIRFIKVFSVLQPDLSPVVPGAPIAILRHEGRKRLLERHKLSI